MNIAGLVSNSSRHIVSGGASVDEASFDQPAQEMVYDEFRESIFRESRNLTMRAGLVPEQELEAAAGDPTEDIVFEIRMLVASGLMNQAAERLAEELAKRTPAEQEALMNGLIDQDPKIVGALLTWVGISREQIEISELFGRVYDRRASADPEAARDMLEEAMRSVDLPYSVGSSLDLARGIATSGSDAVQSDTVRLLLEQSALYADIALRDGQYGTYDRRAEEKMNAAIAAAAGLDTPMGRTLTSLSTKMATASFGFTLDELRLGALDAAGWITLEQTLARGQITVDQSLEHIATLQRYFGYDNATMVSALREIYYPNLLDPFIKDAGAVDASIHSLGMTPGERNGVSASDASFAQAVLFLSKQGQNYVSPMVDIMPGANRPGFPSEFGLDHVIAGLDGYAHYQQGVTGLIPALGVPLAGGDTGSISSVDAVTWLGDLAGTVGVALKAKGTNAERAAQGYEQEMPFEDFNGDMMAFVAIQSAGFDPRGNDLAGTLLAAFDPNGQPWQSRYERFATAVGLTVDPATGAITNADQFVAKWKQTVSALGQGFVKDLSQDSTADAIAELNLRAFIAQLQAGIDRARGR